MFHTGPLNVRAGVPHTCMSSQASQARRHVSHLVRSHCIVFLRAEPPLAQLDVGSTIVFRRWDLLYLDRTSCSRSRGTGSLGSAKKTHTHTKKTGLLCKQCRRNWHIKTLQIVSQESNMCGYDVSLVPLKKFKVCSFVNIFRRLLYDAASESQIQIERC